MNIIIVGLGKVGRALAQQLNEPGNNIKVIDLDADKVSAAANISDIMAVTGNGVSRTVLEEAGIADADLLIAVTGSDERNLLCCLLAKKAGKKCETIARVRSPQYSEDADFLRR